MGTSVEIWERDLVTPGPPLKVCDITAAWDKRFRLAKNDYGSAGVRIQLSDTTATAAATEGRLVKFKRDAAYVAAGVIGETTIRKVERDGKFAEVLELEMLGPLRIGNSGVCQPPNGPGWDPWDRQRPWDWSNPLCDFTALGAVAATQLWQQGTPGNPDDTSSNILTILVDQGRFAWTPPDGFVDGTAWWIWSSGYAGTAGTAGSGDLHMAVGVSYFEGTFTIADDLQGRLIGGADDYFEPAIDGVVLFATAPAPEEAHSRSRQDKVLLSAGTHTVRVKAENFTRVTAAGNIAGLVLAIHEVDPATDATGDVIIHTDSTWKALDYPATPPGFTAGNIALLTLAEIQAEGFLTDVTPTWTATHDSDGNAFPTTSDVVTRLGQPWDEVLLELAKNHVDFQWNHDMTVDMWVKGTHGTASGVTYTPGVNVRQLSFQRDTAPVSSLLIAHAEGVEVLGDATLGRQEFVDLGTLPAVQAMAQAADMLTDLQTDRWAVTIGVEPAGGDVPIDDYQVLDTATVPNPTGTTSAVECIAIAWGLDAAGHDVFSPEFGDVIVSLEERRRRLVKRETLGSLGGRVALPPALPGGSGGGQPSGPGGGGFQPIARTYSMPFERTADVTDTTSWPWPVPASGNLFEVNVRLDTAEAADVDVDVELGGTLITTVTVPAGQTQWTQGGLNIPVVKDADVLTFTCVSVGFYMLVTARIS